MSAPERIRGDLFLRLLGLLAFGIVGVFVAAIAWKAFA